MTNPANSAASRFVLAPFSEERVRLEARACLEACAGKVSCGFVFVSSGYLPHLEDFLEIVQLHGHVPLLVGCSGSGLTGQNCEVENAEGFSLLFLNLPDTRLHACHITQSDIERAGTGPDAWHRITRVPPDQVDAWIALTNPLSFSVEKWLSSWNSAYKGIPTLGGAASGAPRGDEIFLFHNRSAVEGAMLIGFSGGVEIQTVVSQGCRPVGEPFTITGTEGNLVTSLSAKPAYAQLQTTFDALPESDRALARGNLMVGIALSEYVDEFKTGDFLIRNLIGGDPERGALLLAARPRVGQTLQFHLRDRHVAHEQLLSLTSPPHNTPGPKPTASLLFPCSGRGSDLFGTPGHDAQLIQAAWGSHPSAGVFCNGEIGPSGGSSFIHGYTACIATFS